MSLENSADTSPVSRQDACSVRCEQSLHADYVVGDFLRDLSQAELEQHVVDCGKHLEAAYRRFQETADQRARQEAIGWLQLQTEAIALRGADTRSAMERVIDEGLDFFQTEAARQRRMAIARGLA